jgi:hypothetical protein
MSGSVLSNAAWMGYTMTRSGTPRAIVVKTLEGLPADATHWSSRGMAKASGLSVFRVQRMDQTWSGKRGFLWPMSNPWFQGRWHRPTRSLYCERVTLYRVALLARSIGHSRPAASGAKLPLSVCALQPQLRPFTRKSVPSGRTDVHTGRPKSPLNPTRQPREHL